eukprot:TRINITY_DN45394_c0_g1_i1.p1 TRINITY_DN45394_c0_g1~~TRINITY_DN45394_c0_g1_i1.p1  ORF type:complete len:450 (+),score=69.06 TRINITY_DN45394_c0_g1_i1:30-1352(+)
MPLPPHAGYSASASQESRLVCLDGAMPLELSLEAEAVRVGRSVQSVDIWSRLIPDETARNTISRTHFEVVRSYNARWNTFQLRNLSARGTILNGALVQTAEVAMKDGDIIGMGLIETEYGSKPALQFRVCVGKDDVVPGTLGVCLCLAAPVNENFETARLFAGPSGLLRVGRSMQPREFWQAAVPDEALQVAVSREHFQVHPSACGAVLVNLSGAGTLVNGTLVQKQSAIQSGDEVAVPHPRPGRPPIVRFHVAQVKADGPEQLAASDSFTTVAWDQPQAYPFLVDTRVTHEHQASSESSGVVRIALGVLPPPFSLLCVATCGLQAAELEQLPQASRRLDASAQKAELSVGLAAQGSQFWSALLPSQSLQALLAPVHFQLSLREQPQGLALVLEPVLSVPVTLNGVQVMDGMALVRHGDMIGLYLGAGLLVTFRVEMASR